MRPSEGNASVVVKHLVCSITPMCLLETCTELAVGPLANKRGSHDSAPATCEQAGMLQVGTRSDFSRETGNLSFTWSMDLSVGPKLFKTRGRPDKYVMGTSLLSSSVYWGCHTKCHRLKQQEFLLSQSGHWKSEIKVSAGWVPTEAARERLSHVLPWILVPSMAGFGVS